jgi:hypothetical protein
MARTATKEGKDEVKLDPVLTQESTEVVTQQPPKAPPAKREAGGYDVGDVGTGFEDFTQDDLAVPFIIILQKGNPQVEEENAKYVPGAKAGMLMHSVTSQLYNGKEGIVVVPVHRVRSFIEWIPKDDGGGLVTVFDPQAPEVRAVLAKAGKKFGKLKINDNNDLVETFNVFCLMLSGDRIDRVVISMASSMIGPYKKWMTTAQSIQRRGASGQLSTPPLFSHRYRLKTEFFQGKDHTWYKWRAEFDGKDAEAANLPEGSPVFEAAKEFRALLMAGKASADMSQMQQEHTGTDDDTYEM